MAGQAGLTFLYGKERPIEKSQDFKEAKKYVEEMIRKNNTIVKMDICLDLYYNEYKESLKLFEDNMKKRLEYFAELIVKESYTEALNIILFLKEKVHILINELITNGEINQDFLYIYTEVENKNSDLDREI